MSGQYKVITAQELEHIFSNIPYAAYDLARRVDNGEAVLEDMSVSQLNSFLLSVGFAREAFWKLEGFLKNDPPIESSYNQDVPFAVMRGLGRTDWTLYYQLNGERRFRTFKIYNLIGERERAEQTAQEYLERRYPGISWFPGHLEVSGHSWSEDI